jgi:hypothetical protein
MPTGPPGTVLRLSHRGVPQDGTHYIFQEALEDLKGRLSLAKVEELLYLLPRKRPGSRRKQMANPQVSHTQIVALAGQQGTPSTVALPAYGGQSPMRGYGPFAPPTALMHSPLTLEDASGASRLLHLSQSDGEQAAPSRGGNRPNPLRPPTSDSTAGVSIQLPVGNSAAAAGATNQGGGSSMLAPAHPASPLRHALHLPMGLNCDIFRPGEPMVLASPTRTGGMYQHALLSPMAGAGFGAGSFMPPGSQMWLPSADGLLTPGRPRSPVSRAAGQALLTLGTTAGGEGADQEDAHPGTARSPAGPASDIVNQESSRVLPTFGPENKVAQERALDAAAGSAEAEAVLERPSATSPERSVAKATTEGN